MSNTVFDKGRWGLNVLLLLMLSVIAGCHSTRYLGADQYLVRRNTVVLKSDKIVTNRGEIKDNLSRMAIQKPNKHLAGLFPVKLALYNRRYSKLHTRPDSLLPKSVERPVIFDTALMYKSAQNMKSYMFNQGYFYAAVKDTVTFRKKKAYVSYVINAGSNYLINRVNYDFDDSVIAQVIKNEKDATVLKKGIEFTYSLLEEERSRIAAVAANNGYRRFTQENVTFTIDTVDKTLFRVAANPFENAVNFISQVKSNKKTTIDIDIIIRMADDTQAYKKYTVGSVTVYPDYKSVADRTDTTMLKKTIGNIDFKYHEDYVHAHVLHEHIFINEGNVFSKADEDKTISRLGELGIFQYIRVQYRENRTAKNNSLDCSIYLNKTQKHDFSTNYEISSGSTYALGNSVGVNYRDKNFLKGANLLTIGLSGGIELFYNENLSSEPVKRFDILTRYYGLNASIDFPKFLAPIASSLFDNSNLPHTIIGGGQNVIDRVNYFTLVNTSANFSYSWRQSQTKTWGFSPVFINNILLPVQTDSFKKLLSLNEYLKNSYKQTLIEGESIYFKFDNNIKKRGLNYSYVRLSLEEAGGLIGAINTVGDAVNSIYKIKFAQYTKFDFDLRHYFTLPRSVFAFRFSGGIGIPYGSSTTLPYIKQYFAGGPYSLRGWRIRTLGPGRYLDPKATLAANQIDRTGDVKMEWNGEYRFPITPLFAGAIKMNGAIFADAGNIWLARADTNYRGGEIQLATLGQDIAMDMGVGARFDIASFLTFRVDVAMPFKKPSVFTDGGWVLKDVDFYNSTWRANNIILNVSIGYPF